MSKRDIERALRAKGLECATLEFSYQACPGEVVGGWDIELTAGSEDKIALAEPDFSDWDPDCFNSAEVLEWVRTLPSVKHITGIFEAEAAIRGGR